MTEDKKANIECLRALREAMAAYEDLQAVFAVNRGARFVSDPKAALAFLHERSTTRQIEESEKAHARQVQGQLRVQAGARQPTEGSDDNLAVLTSVVHSDGSNLSQPAVGSVRKATDSSPSTSSTLSSTSVGPGGGILGNLGRSFSMKRSASFTAGGSGAGGGSKLDKKALALERQLQIRARLGAVEGRGELWTKGVKPIKSPKSYFTQTYAVLENGKLHFYQEKNNFIELGDTLAEPLSLRDFRVSEDRSTVSKLDVRSGEFSLSKYVRKAVNETDEIRSRDVLAGISFDYRFALNNYRFCLKPTSSRAKRAGYYGIILMAESKKAYHHWLSLFRAASACLDELDAMNVDGSYKESIQFKLTLDAEELVQKNNHKIKHRVDLT